MLEKRRDYRGDFYDFDSTFADSFCIQLFGKNVNELLDDLSKGSLNVPRGAFPNISANPFDPVSLICILETVLFLCKGLPFATRLHVYYAGVLSFMNESYSDNIEDVQTTKILNYLIDPQFFQCFHTAARMYNERYGRLSEPAPETEPRLETPEGSLPYTSGELGNAPLPFVSTDLVTSVPPEPVFETPESHDATLGFDAAGLPVSDPNDVGIALYKEDKAIKETIAKASGKPPPPGADYGGTRRYRRYKSKTRRQTLNKRFKKHRTRRLHGLYVRD
jgi:hypothetical protein